MAVKSVTLVPFVHMALVAVLLAYRPLRRTIMNWKRGKHGTGRPAQSKA
jgi:sulfoxide reductase heme-binding subunit YedZ